MNSNKIVKIVITVVIAIICVVNIVSPSPDATKSSTDKSATSNEEQTKNDATAPSDTAVLIADNFNKSSEMKLSFVEDFVPSDNSGSHYRTEFRLGAYKDAVGKAYTYGDGTADIIVCTDNSMRIYVDKRTLEQCINVIKVASPTMDKTVTDGDIQGAVDEITEKKEANGYSYVYFVS